MGYFLEFLQGVYPHGMSHFLASSSENYEIIWPWLCHLFISLLACYFLYLYYVAPTNDLNVDNLNFGKSYLQNG